MSFLTPKKLASLVALIWAVAMIALIAAGTTWLMAAPFAIALLTGLVVARKVGPYGRIAMRTFAKQSGYRFAVTGTPSLANVDGSRSMLRFDRFEYRNLVRGPLERAPNGIEFCLADVYADRWGQQGVFTACGVSLPLRGGQFDGIYLVPNIPPADSWRSWRFSEAGMTMDRVRSSHGVTLESISFEDKYKLRVAQPATDESVRVLLQPALIQLLVDLPRPFWLQCCGDSLVAFYHRRVSGHAELRMLIEVLRAIAPVLERKLEPVSSARGPARPAA